MAFLSSMNISGSGLTASRLRMDIISENLANQETTRTANGGPYKRKMVVFEPIAQSGFREMMQNGINQTGKKGVQVARIVEDETPTTPVYKPDHPDADENGYVQMPNVDPVKETLDMMAATRAYEANLTAFNAVKTMASKALELGR